MHQDHRRVLPSGDVVRTRDGGDLRRVVAQDPLVGEEIVEAGLVPDHEVGLVVVQRGERDRGGRQVVRDPEPRLVFREALLPVLAQLTVRQIVAPVQAQPARERLARFVVRHAAQVELLRVVRLVAAFGDHAGALRLRLHRFLRVLGAGDLRHRRAREHEAEPCGNLFHHRSLRCGKKRGPECAGA